MLLVYFVSMTLTPFAPPLLFYYDNRALLTENGPCTVNKDTKTTTINPYSWTEEAHVLWLDQPAGVGFSYGSATDSNEDMISEDAYWFLQKFMSEHPEYAENPLFIVGESYGGHYAPAIGHRIWKYNQKLPADDAIVLKFAGVAVGNGLTAPEVQYAVCIYLYYTIKLLL
jgi:cathepsin A (carboxypeptidase C)